MTDWIWFAIALLTVVLTFLSRKLSQRLHKLEEWRIRVGMVNHSWAMDVNGRLAKLELPTSSEISKLIERTKKVPRGKLKK